MVFVKTLTHKAPCFPSCYGTEVRPPVGSSVCFPQFPNSQLGFKEFPGRCSVAILSVIGAYCMSILLRTLIFLNSKILSVNCLDYAFMLISLRSGVTSIAIRSKYSLCQNHAQVKNILLCCFYGSLVGGFIVNATFWEHLEDITLNKHSGKLKDELI